MEGYGTLVYSTGNRYTGTFEANLPHRRGIMFFKTDSSDVQACKYDGKVRRAVSLCTRRRRFRVVVTSVVIDVPVVLTCWRVDVSVVREQWVMGVRVGRGDMKYGDDTPEHYDGKVRQRALAVRRLLHDMRVTYVCHMRVCWHVCGCVQWVADLYDGFGMLTFADGSRYEGTFKCGARHGRCEHVRRCLAVSLSAP